MQKPKPGYKLVKSLFGKYEEIPEYWEYEKLSNMVTKSISYGVLVPDNDPNGIPMIRSGELDFEGGIERNLQKISPKLEDKFAKTRLQGGEILVSLVGYTGQVTLVSPNYAGYNVSRAIGVVNLKKDYNNKFYYYCLKSNSMQRKILYDSIGSAQAVINLDRLRKLTIIVPSKKEQHKIADILSNMDELINHYDRVIGSTKLLKQGLMQQLLTKGIGHKKFKKVKWFFGKFLSIPDEWNLSSMEKISETLSSGGTPSTTILEYWNGAIPWTRGAVLTKHYLDCGERFITKKGLENSSSVIIPKENLLVASRVSVGNLAVNLIDIAINQDVTGIVVDKSQISTDFLYWYLVQNIGILVSYSQGTTIQGFTRKELAKFLILLPDLHEQKTIALILTNIDTKIFDLESKKYSLEKLKKGLMQKLLTGQLRVAA